MNASRPCFTGANAAAAGLLDSGITDPILIVPSIGAVAASGSAQSSVEISHPDGAADVAGAAVVAAAGADVAPPAVVAGAAVVAAGAVVSAAAVVAAGAAVVSSLPLSSPPQAPTISTVTAANAAKVERRRFMASPPSGGWLWNDVA